MFRSTSQDGKRISKKSQRQNRGLQNVEDWFKEVAEHEEVHQRNTNADKGLGVIAHIHEKQTVERRGGMHIIQE